MTTESFESVIITAVINAEKKPLFLKPFTVTFKKWSSDNDIWRLLCWEQAVPTGEESKANRQNNSEAALTVQLGGMEKNQESDRRKLNQTKGQ